MFVRPPRYVCGAAEQFLKMFVASKLATLQIYITPTGGYECVDWSNELRPRTPEVSIADSRWQRMTQHSSLATTLASGDKRY
jgi:hypothetical protein